VIGTRATRDDAPHSEFIRRAIARQIRAERRPSDLIDS
jgi:hypothetical protein